MKFKRSTTSTKEEESRLANIFFQESVSFDTYWLWVYVIIMSVCKIEIEKYKKQTHGTQSFTLFSLRPSSMGGI